MWNLLVLKVRQYKQHLHHRVHIAAVAQVDHPREPGPVQRHQFRPGFLQEIPLVVLLIQVQLHLRHILLSLQKKWNKTIFFFPLRKTNGNFLLTFSICWILTPKWARWSASNGSKTISSSAYEYTSAKTFTKTLVSREESITVLEKLEKNGLIDWLIIENIDWLIDWLTVENIDWLIVENIDWLIDWLIVEKKDWIYLRQWVWLFPTWRPKGSSCAGSALKRDCSRRIRRNFSVRKRLGRRSNSSRDCWSNRSFRTSSRTGVSWRHCWVGANRTRVWKL